MRVKIYVEGGGNEDSTLRRFKSSLVKYCEKVARPGRMPRIIASGSRDAAYRDFKRSLTDRDCDVVALLVDAEQPLLAATAIDHLRARDGWDLPKSSSEKIFLMVECMESWFLADRCALERFYDGRFRGNSLPARSDVENIQKGEVMAALQRATRQCQKGVYHKSRHGFALLAMIDPTLVEEASLFARAFNDFLRGL